jgi:hypothetical protein
MVSRQIIPGDLVKCIEPDGFDFLKTYEVYTVLSVGKETLVLRDPSSDIRRSIPYKIHWFRLYDEEMENLYLDLAKAYVHKMTFGKSRSREANLAATAVKVCHARIVAKLEKRGY